MAGRRKSTRSRSKAQREFVAEVEEILEQMRDELAQLADDLAAGLAPAPDRVNGLFRAAHSLKGLSGMFGLAGMAALAHHLEDALDRLRMGRRTLDRLGLGLFDEAVARVEEVVAGVGDDGAGARAESSLAPLVSRLDAWCREGASPERLDLAATGLDPALLRALTEYEEHRLCECLRAGSRLAVAEVEFELLSFDEGLAQLSERVRAQGELISTLPAPGESPEAGIRFSLLFSTDLDAPELAARIGVEPEQLRLLAPPVAAARQAGPAESSAAPAAAPGAGSLKSLGETVRVDIRKLDELMNLVGELAVQRGALRPLASSLLSCPDTARTGLELLRIDKAMERKVQELQAGVLDVRMVPLRQVFDKLARVVRRLRSDLDKDVRLEIRGAETELDKLIVEELVDPLLHLVRNAFDHAIEPPAERLAAGKPAHGTILLEAFQRGSDVVVQVSDDGRGIDRDAVLRSARARGLAIPDETSPESAIFDLLFEPGLSTREEVSETSGRGVGMDVVRNNVSALGGAIELASRPGQGTTVVLTLPMTLAIVQALVVGVGTQHYAIPLNAVRETVRVTPAEIQYSDGREIFDLRGEALPLRRVARELGLEAAPPEAGGFAVVLRVGEWRAALLVDRLEGQRDAVIKPIQGPAGCVRGIAGATELSERGAVLVLDAAAWVEDARRRKEAA